MVLGDCSGRRGWNVPSFHSMCGGGEFSCTLWDVIFFFVLMVQGENPCLQKRMMDSLFRLEYGSLMCRQNC